MSLELTLNVADLRQATAELMANREQFSETDIVDITLSQADATLRTVGTQSSVRVQSNRPGSLRLPLRLLDNIGESLRDLDGREIRLLCQAGMIKAGTRSFKHSGIELDKTPTKILDLPINLSHLDTLALARILTRSEMEENGMQARADEAEYSRRRAIAAAAAALKEFEIEERKLNHLVESHIQEAAKRLQKTLRAA